MIVEADRPVGTVENNVAGAVDVLARVGQPSQYGLSATSGRRLGTCAGALRPVLIAPTIAVRPLACGRRGWQGGSRCDIAAFEKVFVGRRNLYPVINPEAAAYTGRHQE